LVEKRTEVKKGQRERNVYSLTKAGKKQLKKWAEVPAGVAVPRNELLLKLFFGSHAPVSASRKNVQAFVARQEQALAAYAEVMKGIERRREDPQAPFWLMTLSFGQHYSEALVKWGNETLRELDVIETRQKRLKKRSRRESNA